MKAKSSALGYRYLNMLARNTHRAREGSRASEKRTKADVDDVEDYGGEDGREVGSRDWKMQPNLLLLPSVVVVAGPGCDVRTWKGRRIKTPNMNLKTWNEWKGNLRGRQRSQVSRVARNGRRGSRPGVHRGLWGFL